MYLADVFTRRKREWTDMELIETPTRNFGKAAGLFDEISIKRLGQRDSEPFQIQIRKRWKKTKGPFTQSH